MPDKLLHEQRPNQPWFRYSTLLTVDASEPGCGEALGISPHLRAATDSDFRRPQASRIATPSEREDLKARLAIIGGNHDLPLKPHREVVDPEFFPNIVRQKPIYGPN